MITLQVQNDYNERFAPTGAKKAYIARITGRDSKMTFAREFVGKEIMVDEPGLYELRNTDKKGRADDSYVLIFRDNVGDLYESTESKEFAMKLAKLLDSRSIESCIDETGNIQTAKQAEKITVAKSVDDITQACWTLLQTLPEKQGKKVLSALKALVSPPKEKPAESVPESSPEVASEAVPAIAGSIVPEATQMESLSETYERVVDVLQQSVVVNG
jgi:hypothetical protein